MKTACSAKSEGVLGSMTTLSSSKSGVSDRTIPFGNRGKGGGEDENCPCPSLPVSEIWNMEPD